MYWFKCTTLLVCCDLWACYDDDGCMASVATRLTNSVSDDSVTLAFLSVQCLLTPLLSEVCNVSLFEMSSVDAPFQYLVTILFVNFKLCFRGNKEKKLFSCWTWMHWNVCFVAGPKTNLNEFLSTDRNTMCSTFQK